MDFCVYSTWTHRFLCTRKNFKPDYAFQKSIIIIIIIICVIMLFEHYIMLHLSYVAQQTEPMSMSKPHILLLSDCLHFMSLKMTFIYSIITHFSKLFPHCQHNLLPSALMAAQFWMVDGYLIGETTSHQAQEVKENWEKGKDKNQEHKLTSAIYFMPIH